MTVNTERDARYYAALERLIHEITSLEHLDLEGVYGALRELCVLLRVAKGVTMFYDSPINEAKGVGEEFVCYDSGEENRLVLDRRFVSPAGIVVVCAVYQAVGAEPFDDVERERVDLIMRTILTYLSKRRLQGVVERMTYWDNDGFRNLRYFLNRMMELAQAGPLKGWAALRMNLKHFSLINHQLGRQAGDKAMKLYIGQFERALGEDGFIGRLGGDNFVAMFRVERLDEALSVLRGRPVFLRDCAEPDQIDEFGPDDAVTIAAISGVFVIPDDYDFHGPGDIMDKMTSAFQSSKNGRDGDVVFYTDALSLNKEKVMRIQQRFARALKDEEFLVYYQPKVDIRTRELIGAEALCRWYHEGRIVPPLDFIPVLERGYDICKLDFYMLDHVCRDIVRWLAEGRQVVRVSVNLSRRHMTDAKLFEHILEIVDRNGVPHELIEIELTETTTDVEFRDLKRVVSQLQEAGIFTSVDDFGVGYSSLNLIKEIPWNVLKLDKSLLPASEKKVRGSLMFRHVVAMAHEIGLKCVAEGVETPEQMKILKDFGCHIAQGFYFDKPLPVGEFEERLDRHKY